MAAKRKSWAVPVKSSRSKTSKRANPARRAAPRARAKAAAPKAPARAKATATAAPPKKAPARAKAKAKAKAPMLQKVAFTMFSVADATRARAFYEGVLGLTRGLAAPNGVWTEYDLPGGGCLALFCHPDPKFARAPGGASVAFEVADLDALNQQLAAAGVVYQGDMVHGPRCRMSNILDSEGNSIILHQLTRTVSA
jgi:catechol 2,3-dioxygenase-like lactoylglutathione lyase family enzyme